MTDEQIKGIEERIEEQIQRLNLEDAKILSEILKNIKEGDAAEATKHTERTKIVVQIAGDVIRALIGGALYLHGIHLGFQFEQTGSITSRTMNSIFLKPPKM